MFVLLCNSSGCWWEREEEELFYTYWATIIISIFASSVQHKLSAWCCALQWFFLMWVLSVREERCLELYIRVSLKKGKSWSLKSNVKANVYCGLLHIRRDIQVTFPNANLGQCWMQPQWAASSLSPLKVRAPQQLRGDGWFGLPLSLLTPQSLPSTSLFTGRWPLYTASCIQH